MKDLLKIGDYFRISSRQMSHSGKITKINRVTFDWTAEYFGNPISGKTELHHLKRATIMREPQLAFSIL